MPYLITCDHCGTSLRTRACRPAGDVIDCPKCGDRFEVRAGNKREEAPTAAWEVVGDEGPANLPKKTAHRDDDEDDRPRRRRRSSGGGRLPVWIGLAVGGALLVGVGLFFLLRGSDGGPPAEVAKALAGRPKGDLPKELFAYWSPEQTPINYTDN